MYQYCIVYKDNKPYKITDIIKVDTRKPNPILKGLVKFMWDNGYHDYELKYFNSLDQAEYHQLKDFLK